MHVRRSFGFPLSVATRTDVGRVRSNNEDSFGCDWLEDGSLFVMVADGMGGHEAGEVASGLAVRVVSEGMRADLAADPRKRLYKALLEANQAILDEGRTTGARGMGTTAITGLLQGSKVYIGQVGDSRLYHIRHGRLVWRTSDHTRVQMLLDNGDIGEEEARGHPEAGMLTRALGHSRMADGRNLAPDVLESPLEIEERDVLVLCSDGLHDLLEDGEIGQLVAGATPAEAAQRLVEAACERGGHDNVTVAVVIAGDRADPYDPDYDPNPAPPAEEPEVALVEATFEDVSSLQPPEPPPPPARSWLFPGIVGAGMLTIGLLALGLLVALALGGAWFYYYAQGLEAPPEVEDPASLE